MNIVYKWWRLILYIVGICILIWGIMTGNTITGVVGWLACTNVILIPIIVDEVIFALEEDDDED